ncbi:hypothetical protein HDU99_005012, partial [Rhizoclosmatium hyalinum]
YKRTKKEVTRFGLTINDEVKEIGTIEEKLEFMCLQYVRQDQLKLLKMEPSVEENNSEYKDYKYDPVPSPTRKTHAVPHQNYCIIIKFFKEDATAFKNALAAKNEMLKKAISEKAAVKREK